MTIENLIGFAIALVLLAYLIFSLLHPDR
ncbi:potassium-transporting ATPase subunit F [Microlunatus elymi]|uniref:Potassium-transporting ATPase subunit F n=1 Tax=Microlunatus elymi TaxID=2596828 RepID=A0A516Q678_9ACTN|nr:potassium-transporting ATPase subunit F [Microlunatus elymi]